MAEETDEVEQWEMGRSWFSQEKWDDNKPNIHKARQRYGHSLSLYIAFGVPIQSFMYRCDS